MQQTAAFLFLTGSGCTIQASKRAEVCPDRHRAVAAAFLAVIAKLASGYPADEIALKSSAISQSHGKLCCKVSRPRSSLPCPAWMPPAGQKTRTGRLWPLIPWKIREKWRSVLLLMFANTKILKPYHHRLKVALPYVHCPACKPPSAYLSLFVHTYMHTHTHISSVAGAEFSTAFFLWHVMRWLI